MCIIMHAINQARKSKATYNLRVHIILHECVVVKLVFHVPSNNVFSTTQKKLSFVIVVTSVSTNSPFVSSSVCPWPWANSGVSCFSGIAACSTEGSRTHNQWGSGLFVRTYQFDPFQLADDGIVARIYYIL